MTERGAQWVGRPLRRLEDRRFLTGAARYLGDLRRANEAHVAFVRSPHAHARIKRIAADAARSAPGVLAVVTGADLSPAVRPIRATFHGTPFNESDYPVLALGVVRFAGEPVAAVVAEDRYLAEDACELVDVDYELLTPVVTSEAALADGAPLIHDELPGNVFIDERKDVGDVDAERSRAAFVVERTFTTQRSAAAPLECRGALAEMGEATGRLTLWTGTQIPHVVRYGLAECLGLPEDRVRVISPDVGGGFGNKASMDPEQVVVCALARRLGRPVKWLEDRRENLSASTHSHEERIWLRLSADAAGRFLSLESDILLNGGAYSSFPDPPCNELLNCANCMVGPYRLVAYRHRGRAVVTTTCPYGPIRGIARAQANFALERLVDILARTMRVDRLELRRRNLLVPADFPYETITGLFRDSGDYVRALDLAVERLGWDAFAAERAAGRRVGVGVACFAEECSSGTVRRIPRQLYAIAGYDGATVRVDMHGRATVFSSAAGSGEGHETSLAQLAADELGIPPERIAVREGDTDLVPYGMGSTGSRTAVSSGGAVLGAARKVRAKILALGAHLLEAPVEDVALRTGAVYVRADPARAVSLDRIAWVAYRREGGVPAGFEPGLEEVAFYDPPAHGVSSNSVHAVAVEVDPATGAVRLLRYVVVEDTGRMLNPVIVEGQIRGGATQGIAKSLYEHVLYDAESGQPQNATLMDFLVPTACEVPPIEVVHMETPSPFTAGGMKGCGESGIIGSPAAIGNAIVDALGARGELVDLPFTPERVRLLAQATGGRAR